ncbi:MAG: alpha-amylase [Nitrosomonas sp.]|nr:MAG: alpha-amylase [Nitrosomonas sp.]
MYEQVSHSLLNEILDHLKPEIKRRDLRYFYIRLGANFYAIHSLYHRLYGDRADFETQMVRLVETLARNYIARDTIYKLSDREREKNHNWFLSQNWVGMALYTNGFADNLKDLKDKAAYFQELGVNLVHIMPVLQCPVGSSDGGYAVSNYRQIDDRIGNLNDLKEVANEFKKRDILLVMDVVVNHTSVEHEWAQKARQGDEKYQNYYHTFDTREVPDMFEHSMPEVFPETDPGNFTWDTEMQKWVMTVFHHYQWDLNYRNPSVFIEMLDIILFWANQGVDIVRLDAVAFLWKKMGTSCQNEREAHLILQLMKDCCQVTAPGLLFIAEAIVAPSEVIKYFGEDAIVAKECEIAYNATFMALLWDAVATKNSKLLRRGLRSLPDKLERATWLNYVRSHDDIGFGFDDQDIKSVDYDPSNHRRFLIDYFTGNFEDSAAKGLPFAYNKKTGDARICGSLASLIGLESAMERSDENQTILAIRHILLLHSLILSFGGIPLLYYGDEIGVINDRSYSEDQAKIHDNRWLHRPKINWDKAEHRHQHGTVEHTIFSELAKMIAVRKETAAFADFNNRELLDLDNEHLFAFIRFNHEYASDRIIVVANLDGKPHKFDLDNLFKRGFCAHGSLIDIVTGRSPTRYQDELILQPFQFYWLAER